MSLYMKIVFLIVKETPTKLEKKSLVGIHVEYRSEEDTVQISNDNEQKKGKWSITHCFWGSQNGWLLLKSVLASLLFEQFYLQIKSMSSVDQSCTGKQLNNDFFVQAVHQSDFRCLYIYTTQGSKITRSRANLVAKQRVGLQCLKASSRKEHSLLND